MSQMRMLGPGDELPDVTLPGGENNQPVRLREFIGQKILVVYFYPKDETPGCTAEACRFRDEYEDFVTAGAEVIGISQDSHGSHEVFRTKHQLPFLLLSDEDGMARKQFGVKHTFGLLPGRVTFVVDQKGIIRQAFSSQIRIQAHIDQAMALVKALAAQA